MARVLALILFALTMAARADSATASFVYDAANRVTRACEQVSAAACATAEGKFVESRTGRLHRTLRNLRGRAYCGAAAASSLANRRRHHSPLSMPTRSQGGGASASRKLSARIASCARREGDSAENSQAFLINSG